MSRKRKLSKKDIKKAQEMLLKGENPRIVAEKFGVHRSVIYRRAKDPLIAEKTPPKIKNKVIQKIREGYSKAEAANMYGLNIGTVRIFTREMGIKGHEAQGHHIIRKHGIELLNRLLENGCVVSGFVVSTMRNLQRKLPVIRSARYKNKMFFYLPGREEETVEAFFKELPDRVISYTAIEELSYLLDVKISSKSKHTLLRRYKDKHNAYWRSRHLVQITLDHYADPMDSFFKTKQVRDRVCLLPKKGKW